MPTEIVEKVIPIVNMDCASCAKTIERELKEIPGIREIKFNILMKKVTVRYNRVQADLPQIEGKIEDAGYRIGYKKYRGFLDKILGVFKSPEDEGPRIISDHEFKEYVLGSKYPVIVEFASATCPSCRGLGRILTTVEGKYRDKVYFYQMDVNTTSRWRELRITSVPALIYFRDGKEIFRQSGLPRRDEIVQRIEKLLK